LPHLALSDDGTPLRLKRFTGHALLRDLRLEFQQSKIETADGIYLVSGTASPGRLELKLTDRNSNGYGVSGTLEKPRVVPLTAAETRAQLGR